MIIAKEQQAQQTVGYYELFQPAKAIGMNGEEIDVMQSVGSYSLQQLESEKVNYNNAISKIDEKIEAINILLEE
jgi:hypothetical protein